MYEPTDREVNIEVLKTLNKIEDKLNWIVVIGAAIFISILLR